MARLALVTDQLPGEYLSGALTQEEKEALTALWDSCQEYQAAFENFSAE